MTKLCWPKCLYPGRLSDRGGREVIYAVAAGGAAIAQDVAVAQVALAALESAR
jgi:hypothetical protein